MSSREEFEAWCLAGYSWLDRLSSLEWLSTEADGSYRYAETATRWKVWQASRAALVIELPVINDNEWACTSGECSAMRDAIERCEQKIHSAGIKTR